MHTLVLVLVPRTAKDIRHAVEKVLEGSRGNGRTYPLRPQPCYCLGDALHAAFGEVDSTPEGVRRHEEINEARTAENYELVERLLAERLEEVWAVERQHPRYGKPNPECDTCRGSGICELSVDPSNHWDYWVIGGRWDGGLEPYSHDPGIPEDVRRNCAAVKDLPEDIGTGAVIGSDGLWLEPTDITINFPMPARSPDALQAALTWDDQVKGVLHAHQDWFAVAVDCHY